MKFNSLPNEILEAILLHLPKKQIRQLTLVSPKFNHVISNSLLLMEAFEVKWTMRYDKAKFKSTRKYRSVEHKSSRFSSAFLFFFERHHDSLKCLKFRCKLQEQHSSTLRCILERVSNQLESLTLSNGQMLGNKQPIVFKKLHTLTLDSSTMSDFFLMPIFSLTKLKSFEEKVGAFQSLDKNSEERTRFYETQSHLERLELHHMSLFQHPTMNNVNFQLTELVVHTLYHHSSFFDPGVINFRKFLRTQTRSLRKLHLAMSTFGEQIMDEILEMNLTSLTFNNCQFKWDQLLSTNKTIKQLEIAHTRFSGPKDAVQLLLRACKNVEFVNYIGADLTADTSIELALHMPTLAHLILDKPKEGFKIIKFESLTWLEIDDTNNCAEKEETFLLILANKHLKKIRVSEKYQNDQSFAQFLEEAKIPVKTIEFKKFE